MVGEKIAHTGINFVVFTVLARELGPTTYGYFSLIQVFLLLGWPIAIFAHEQVLIKYTLDDQYKSSLVYKTTLLLKICGSLIAFGLCVFLSYFLFGKEIALQTSILCLIYFVQFDVVFFPFFRAHKQSKYIFYARLVAALPSAAIKIIIVVKYRDINYLLLAYVLEALIFGMLAIWLYSNRNFSRTKESHKYEKRYLKHIANSAWPILTATLVAVLYTKVDQLMIKHYLGDLALGHYSAAVKLSETSTMLKSLRMSTFFGIATFVGALALADYLLPLILGEGFLPSSSALKLHLLGAIFLYHGTLCTQWLVASNLEIYRLIRVLAGLCINILLNFILIPKYGITGAALATIISQFLSNYLLNYLSPKTRPFYYLQNRALFSTR